MMQYNRLILHRIAFTVKKEAYRAYYVRGLTAYSPLPNCDAEAIPTRTRRRIR